MFGVKDAYEDGDADFHTSLQRWQTYQEAQAKKTINLGLFYGMGKAKLQAELGVSKDKAEELFIYHSRVPFVKIINESVSNRAQQRGQIRTLLGRYVGFIYGNQILLVCIKHYHLTSCPGTWTRHQACLYLQSIK